MRYAGSERRNVAGAVAQKRVSFCLGPVSTRGRKPPADIKDAATEHMAAVNGAKIPAERITTIDNFVVNVYLPWIEAHTRPRSVTPMWGASSCVNRSAQAFCLYAFVHVRGWLRPAGQDTTDKKSKPLWQVTTARSPRNRVAVGI